MGTGGESLDESRVQGFKERMDGLRRQTMYDTIFYEPDVFYGNVGDIHELDCSWESGSGALVLLMDCPGYIACWAS